MYRCASEGGLPPQPQLQWGYGDESPRVVKLLFPSVAAESVYVAQMIIALGLASAKGRTHVS